MSADPPKDAITRASMYANLRGDIDAGMNGCHGCFSSTGQDHAALALFEAMSEVSEERIFAGWEDGNGETIWRWLQTGEMHTHGCELGDLDDLRLQIIALANVSGIWWADYEYAVPLKSWIVEHGQARGVGPCQSSGRGKVYIHGLPRLDGT